MQKSNIIFCILLSVNTIINAQVLLRPTISGDSLLVIFETMDAFDVLDKTDLSKVDIYDCYHHEKLKPYLLIWLNKDAYFEYDNKQYIKRVFDDDYKVYKVKSWLTNRNQKSMVDTVMNNPSLFQVYLDSVVNATTIYMKELYFKDGGKLPSKVLDFHARLKLPEAYAIINKYWKENGSTIKSDYFNVMLAMHDPEAIAKYNNFVDSVIKNTDLIALNDIRTKANYEYLYGSYAVELKLKLLTVKQRISHSFSNFPEGAFDSPYNIDFLNPLSDRCFQYSQNETVLKILNALYNPIDKIYGLTYGELEKYCNEIIQNIDAFKQAVQPYKDNLIREELYWKKNMPFYKEGNTH